MYGLVNKALEDLVLTHFGEEAWNAVREGAGLGDENFDIRQNYDDELTFRLVGSACEHFMQSADVLLKLFGRHWILFTGREGWMDYFASDCKGSIDFLEKLNTMHEKIRDELPGSQPPQVVLHRTADGYELEYHSHREGLAPVMEGILEGLAEYYEEPWMIEQTHFKAQHGEDRFSLRNVGRSLQEDDSQAA